ERTLDEVKDRVVERWRQEQIAARLRAKATELADKLKTSGGQDDAILGDLKWQTASGIKRDRSVEGVPARARGESFSVSKGAVSASEGDNPAQWIVFRVTDITVPPLDMQSEEAKQIQENLRTAYAEDLVAQYVGQLQIDLGAVINEAALNQAIGARI